MPRSVLEPLVLEAQSAIFWKVSRKEEKAVEVARSWVCSLALLHRNSSNRGRPAWGCKDSLLRRCQEQVLWMRCHERENKEEKG